MDYINYISLQTLINNKIVNIDNNKSISNIKNQYIELLSMLTVVSDMSNDTFINKINEIYNCGHIIIAVVGNLDNDNDFKIIGSGTIILEPKLIRNTKYVAHVEDIIVHTDFRGFGISTVIINMLKQYAHDNNCYKLILNCDITVCKVYEKCGFENLGIEMGHYFKN